MSGSYTLDCECPKCGARVSITAGKWDTDQPDKCPECAARGDDVNLKIRKVTVNDE